MNIRYETGKAFINAIDNIEETNDILLNSIMKTVKLKEIILRNKNLEINITFPSNVEFFKELINDNKDKIVKKLDQYFTDMSPNTKLTVNIYFDAEPIHLPYKFDKKDDHA